MVWATFYNYIIFTAGYGYIITIAVNTNSTGRITCTKVVIIAGNSYIIFTRTGSYNIIIGINDKLIITIACWYGIAFFVDCYRIITFTGIYTVIFSGNDYIIITGAILNINIIIRIYIYTVIADTAIYKLRFLPEGSYSPNS